MGQILIIRAESDNIPRGDVSVITITNTIIRLVGADIPLLEHGNPSSTIGYGLPFTGRNALIDKNILKSSP